MRSPARWIWAPEAQRRRVVKNALGFFCFCFSSPSPPFPPAEGLQDLCSLCWSPSSCSLPLLNWEGQNWSWYCREQGVRNGKNPVWWGQAGPAGWERAKRLCGDGAGGGQGLKQREWIQCREDAQRGAAHGCLLRCTRALPARGERPTRQGCLLQSHSQPTLHPACICACGWPDPAAGPCTVTCGTSCGCHRPTSGASQDLSQCHPSIIES